MSSNIANQGSVNSDALSAPFSLAQPGQDSQARLRIFNADNQLESGSVHRIGSPQGQKNRTQRVSAVIADVEQLVPYGVDVAPVQGQANNDQTPDLRGVGEQFSVIPSNASSD
ncbi:uncharacterized protein ColSpa_03462 [Colletotrichum spaethianum]|uniref:Uncharacterized protein n=1 Tax=Colletotrichum spaethianum TaxID=700344 RepID=A0AA37P5A7_9PEZI|nr:uncharacterized protein ColSpa_03462 [Colletotrichum spaethianum]GKT43281.1 hypothetical protein ColSpa_03462 [Colletotrichum spaethianum]